MARWIMGCGQGRRRFCVALIIACALALGSPGIHAQSDDDDEDGVQTMPLQTVPAQVIQPVQPGQTATTPGTLNPAETRGAQPIEIPRPLQTVPAQVIQPAQPAEQTTVSPGTQSATPIEIPRLETAPAQVIKPGQLPPLQKIPTLPQSGLQLRLQIDASGLYRQTASAVLRSSALKDATALIQQISTPAGLTSLSSQSGVGRENLLYLAHELQLKQTIGLQNIADTELQLLDEMGIDSLTQLARFRGSENRLAASLAQLAARKGIPPPVPERVARWVANSGAAPNRIPPTAKLMRQPQAALTTASVVAVAKLPQLSPTVVTAILGGKRQFSIPQGEGELVHEFVATQPGLYRGEIQFDRKGGLASLGWQIERPNVVFHFDDGRQLNLARPSLLGKQPVKTTVTGYQRLIGPGSPLAQIQTNQFYFWVKPADLALNNRLRLRLTVLQNRPNAPSSSGGIEQSPTGGSIQSAPIEGSLSIQRQAPIRLPDFEEDVTVSLAGGPLQIIETPVFTLRPEDLQKDYELSFSFEPAGARRPELLGADWRQQEAWKLKAQAPDRHLWSRIHVLHDNAPIAGRFGNGVTADYVVIDKPPLGVYRVLAMAGDRPDFTQLMTQGYVVDSYQNPSPGSFTASVRVGKGQRPAVTYVAELEALEVSDQAELNDDDNDEGDGEFKVVSTTTLSKQGQESKESRHVVTATYPDYAPFMGPRHVNILPAGSGNKQRNIVFPRLPLANFSKEQLDAYDGWGTVITVVEDDSHTWWQEHKQLFEAMFSWVELAWDLASLDFFGAFQTAVFDLAENLRSVGLEDVDDQMGHPNFAVTKEQDYGFFNKENEYLLELEGSSDTSKTGSAGVSGPANTVPAGAKPPLRAIVSINNGDQRWARAQVRLRKRLALDNWMDIRLVSFKLSNNVPVYDSQPVEVYIRSGKPVYDTMDKKGFWEAPKVVKAVPGQSVSVDDPRPPTMADVESVASIKERKSGLLAVRYAQFEFWRRRPGDDEFLGFVSNAFYAEDFLRFADWPARDIANKYKGDAYTNGRMSVSYRTMWPFYVGEFVIRNPGPSLEEVKLVAYTHIKNKKQP